jgi:pimeloyl-ACP methyl ester carboxylesterase
MRAPAATLEAHANEPAAAASLAGRGFAEAVRRLEETHEAIAARSFGAAGAQALPARSIHDAITAASYGAVRIAGSAVGTTAAAALRARPPQAAADRISASRVGALVLGALNGLIGDRLDAEHRELSIPTELRLRGRPVPVERSSLAGAYPEATARLVVFVHGLCETEAAWWLGAERRWGDPDSTYGSRIQRDIGLTPLYVRYNTGLHVSESGARLARLLEDLVGEWPRAVSDLAIVGHSMGGLVARSACAQGERDGHRWIAATKRIVYLGTPHLGAPLEKLTNVAAAGLAAVPETRPVATVLRTRSAGIKDLRYGALLEDDWVDCDPDALLGDPCSEVPLLASAEHYAVCATVTRKPEAPLGRMVGDLLVLYASGSGRGGRRRRRIRFAEENGSHLPSATHFDLLNHPEVDELLHAWLA